MEIKINYLKIRSKMWPAQMRGGLFCSWWCWDVSVASGDGWKVSHTLLSSSSFGCFCGRLCLMDAAQEMKASSSRRSPTLLGFPTSAVETPERP